MCVLLACLPCDSFSRETAGWKHGDPSLGLYLFLCNKLISIVSIESLQRKLKILGQNSQSLLWDTRLVREAGSLRGQGDWSQSECESGRTACKSYLTKKGGAAEEEKPPWVWVLRSLQVCGTLSHSANKIHNLKSRGVRCCCCFCRKIYKLGRD